MSIIKLTSQEVEVIKSSIELRRESCKDEPDWITELEDILERLNRPIIDLKPMQRTTLIGCIKEYTIYPNSDLFGMTDFEILSNIDSIRNKLNYLDIGIGAINRLKTKKEKKSRLFKETIEKVDKLSKSDKVYYSENEIGNINKIGMLTEPNKGIKIEADGSAFDILEIEKLNKDVFMKIGKPLDALNSIKSYEKNFSLTENQNRMKKILEKACV